MVLHVNFKYLTSVSLQPMLTELATFKTKIMKLWQFSLQTNYKAQNHNSVQHCASAHEEEHHQLKLQQAGLACPQRSWIPGEVNCVGLKSGEGAPQTCVCIAGDGSQPINRCSCEQQQEQAVVQQHQNREPQHRNGNRGLGIRHRFNL